ncbi:unnamed protein product [Spirodela intermedia]|uniref:Uncharacterized protein n=1 Tax=Spirodela intermedia TaxID=51605 RepID=A0A7I8IT46_SPIIN|nr:unnamed protein product [Spirodela intermedia]CAA6661054.1 unnamed protein product [Spirodela intermedia]
MPRSSRHESSHRGHGRSSRDARERSDSEEEETSRERKSRETSLLFVSAFPGKGVSGTENGDYGGGHGGKKKDRHADSASPADRGDDGDEQDSLDETELKVEDLGHVDLEEMAKTKVSTADSKVRSSRRHESSSDRKNDSGKRSRTKTTTEERAVLIIRTGRTGTGSAAPRGTASTDRRGGLERGRESRSEKERERGSEREKKNQDAKRDRSEDTSTRKRGGTASSLDEEYAMKRDVESDDWQMEDGLHSAELEKEMEKQDPKRRDDLRDCQDGDNSDAVLMKSDKSQGEARDGDDKRPHSRENRMKNGSQKDDKHRDGSHRDKHKDDGSHRDKYKDDGSYKDKYRDDGSYREKHRDDKVKDDYSRDHNSRSHGKHYRDDKKSESAYKKSKHHDSDYDGSPYAEDRDSKYRDSRGRKRPSDEGDDHVDAKSRNAKEPRVNLERSASNSFNVDRSSDRDRQEDVQDRTDSQYNQPKGSPSSSAQHTRYQNRKVNILNYQGILSSSVLCSPLFRHSSKQVEATGGSSLSEERPRVITTSTGDTITSPALLGKASEPRSLERSSAREEKRVNESSVRSVSSSKHERSPRSDHLGSPTQLTEKTPSTASDRRRSGRSSMRHNSLDAEDSGQRSSISKEDTEKPIADDPDSFSGGFPGHLSPAMRFGMDNPGMASFDEDGSFKAGTRYKRNMDLSMNRAQGNIWKGVHSWPSPAVNGFIPFQHMPPPGGFLQQFPPSLFGVRPHMDMSHPGVPYHLHEASERFGGHGRPYLWPNPADGSISPHMQVWDESGGLSMDDPHMYGRPEWEQSRHSMAAMGWEMNADARKGQNGTGGTDFMKEADYSRSAHPSRTEPARSPAESAETRGSQEAVPGKERIQGPSKSDDSARFCSVYLSRLDISAGLAGPELYKQCMELIGGADPVETNSKVSNCYLQSIGGDPKVESKEPVTLSSYFPALPETVFERAMSLYNKQSEDRKAKAELLFFKEEEKRVLPPSAAEAAVAEPENPPTSEDIIIPTKEDLNATTTITTDAQLVPPCCPTEEQSAATTTTDAQLAPHPAPRKNNQQTPPPTPSSPPCCPTEEQSAAAARRREATAQCRRARLRFSRGPPAPCEDVLMEESGALNVSLLSSIHYPTLENFISLCCRPPRASAPQKAVVATEVRGWAPHHPCKSFFRGASKSPFPSSMLSSAEGPQVQLGSKKLLQSVNRMV